MNPTAGLSPVSLTADWRKFPPADFAEAVSVVLEIEQRHRLSYRAALNRNPLGCETAPATPDE